MTRDYCSFCSLVVAQADPQRTKKGDRTYHGLCWERKVNREFEAQRELVLETIYEHNVMLPDLPIRFD